MPQKSLWKNESLSAVGSSIIIMLVILIFGKVDLLTVSFAAGQDRLTVGYDKDLVGVVIIPNAIWSSIKTSFLS